MYNLSFNYLLVQILVGALLSFMMLGIKVKQIHVDRELKLRRAKLKKDRLIRRLQADRERIAREKDMGYDFVYNSRYTPEEREKLLKPDTSKFYRLMAEYEALYTIPGLYEEMMEAPAFESCLFSH